MKPLPTRPFRGPFPTLPAGFSPATLSWPGSCFVEAPGSDFPEAGGIRTPPRKGPGAPSPPELADPPLGCYALLLVGRRILLTEKSHYAIQ